MPPPPKQKPLLVNRGAAGLLTALPKPATNGEAVPVADAKAEKPTFVQMLLAKHQDAASAKIAGSLADMVVSIPDLTPDPNNARRHPERNMEAIMSSLAAHGQVKPLVVRKQGMIVMAGNGTLEAAKRLGWTEVAASVVEMSEAEAAAYGLADNRTAELATWDFATVSRLEQLISEAGMAMTGWSDDELTALRLHDFVPPPTDFPEMDENIETLHVCPKCNYRFSGGEVVAASTNGQEPVDGGEDDEGIE